VECPVAPSRPPVTKPNPPRLVPHDPRRRRRADQHHRHQLRAPRARGLHTRRRATQSPHARRTTPRIRAPA
jgi:hypothetical protein